MKVLLRKSSSKRGFVLIAILAISFVLLALGSILMGEAFSHMNNSYRYSSRAEALAIAKYGVNKAIYELEDDMTWAGMTDSPYGEGTVTVEVNNNFSNPHPSGEVPANSILLRSTGKVAEGKFKRTVITILTYQIMPYTSISDGRVALEGATDFTFNLEAVPGYRAYMHSNYDPNSPNYDAANPESFELGVSVDMHTDDSVLSASGSPSADFEAEFTSGGGTVESREKQEFPEVTYESLKPEASQLTRLDHKAISGPYTFLGKLRNKGGELEAYYKVPILGVMWLPVVSTEHGDFTPDGMSWDGTTGTITITGDKNYYWDGSLELENINIVVAEDCRGAFFIDGHITTNNVSFTSNNFLMAGNKGMTSKDCTFHLENTTNKEGLSLFCNGNYEVSTSETEVISGGNYYSGVVYIKNGSYIFNNECTIDTSDNSMTLEGLLIVEGNSSGEGIIINNNGSDNFTYTLRYNPHIISDMFTNVTSDIQLQPVFWQIK